MNYTLKFSKLIQVYYNSITSALIYDYLLSLLNGNSYAKVNLNNLKKDLFLTDYEYRNNITKVANYVNSNVNIGIEQNLFNGKAFYYYYDKKTKLNFFFFNEDNHKKIMDNAIYKIKHSTKINSNTGTSLENNNSDENIFLNIDNKLFKFEVTPFIAQAENLKNSFTDFIINRGKKKITQDIVTDYCLDCELLSESNIEKAVAICKRSAKYNWKDLFPLEKTRYFSGSNGAMKTKNWQSLKNLKNDRTTAIAKRLADEKLAELQKKLNGEIE